MNAQLILTMESSIIQQARNYAKDRNSSLSNIIENYLKILTEKEQQNKIQNLNPVVASLKGSFRMPNNMDYEEELRNRVEEKYL
ncbi:MAG: DUF6364 family protein [Mangrovibacterium sp.]